MLRVLIIDDEPNVRQGLKIIVPWEKHGFEVCGDSGDADEGLEKIFDLKPDIVLIDIKMPGRLGTDIIREAREKNFNGKFIIISGYSNFEYAKDAIKYGVKSYILKPVDEDELMDILLELKKEIDIEKKWEGEKRIVDEVNLQKLILEGAGDIERSYFQYDNFQIVLITNCMESDNNESSLINLENVIKEKLEAYANDIQITRIKNYIVLLFKDFRTSRIERTLEDLKKKIYLQLKIKLFMVIGEKVKIPTEINKSYRSAKSLMKYSFLYLDKEIISLDDIDKENNFNDEFFDVEKIYSYVEVNDFEQIDLEFKNMKSYFINKKYLEEDIKIMAIKILLELKEKLLKDYELENAILPNKENMIRQINAKKSLNDLILYLNDNFISMSKLIGEKSADNIIKKMVNYINKNYYKDLKLEGLASIFNYNSAYLGKLFKSEIGENFNTYLDKVRIEKAKGLLVEEHLKVYQVSERVGYKNIDYFHSKFRKYVGMSPMQYKKNNE